MTYNHDLIIATWTHRDNDVLKKELRKRWPELGHALDLAAVEDIIQMANGDKPWTLTDEAPAIKPVLPAAVQYFAPIMPRAIVEDFETSFGQQVLRALQRMQEERRRQGLSYEPLRHATERQTWRGPDIKGVYIDEHLPDTNEVIVRVKEGE